MFWMLLLLALSSQNVPTQANFGLSVSFSGVDSLLSNARGLNGALDTITQNTRNLNSPGQADKLQSTIDLITQLTSNVTTLGKFMVGNVTRTAEDNTTPVTELFSTLHLSLNKMSNFLASEAQNITASLNNTLGSTSIMDIKKFTFSFHDDILNVTNITIHIEMEVGKTSDDSNKLIMSSLISSLSEALVRMKNQAVLFSNVVATISRNINSMNAYLTNFYRTTKSGVQRLNTAQHVRNQIPAEKDNALKRYFSYHSAITSELSSAVERLEVFAQRRELHPLINRHSEGYTKIFYYLHHRSESDVMNITTAYDAIVSSSNKLVQQSYANFSNQIQQIVFNLTNLYLAQEPNVELCYRKYSNELLSPLNGLQNLIEGCLNKERGRLGRINGATEQILQLIQQNSQDFAANIASCATQTNFANYGDVHKQAEACLATNLNQMAEFQQTIGLELDEMLRVYAIEIAASQFRQSNCMASRTNEARAAALNLETQLMSCVFGARKFIIDESDEFSNELLAADQEEIGYELVDMLVR